MARFGSIRTEPYIPKCHGPERTFRAQWADGSRFHPPIEVIVQVAPRLGEPSRGATHKYDQWADGFDFHPPIKYNYHRHHGSVANRVVVSLTKRFAGWVPSATKEGTHPVVSYARLCSVNTEQRRALCEGRILDPSFLLAANGSVRCASNRAVRSKKEGRIVSIRAR